jgi:hypothetical protein
VNGDPTEPHELPDRANVSVQDRHTSVVDAPCAQRYRARNSIVMDALPFAVLATLNACVPPGASVPLLGVAEARLGVPITAYCVIGTDAVVGLLAVPTHVGGLVPTVTLITSSDAATVAPMVGWAGGVGSLRPNARDDTIIVVPTMVIPPAAILRSASRRSTAVAPPSER